MHLNVQRKSWRRVPELLSSTRVPLEDAQALSAEETDVQSAIATVRNINLRIQVRQETLAHQTHTSGLHDSANLRRETVSTREGSLRPVADLSSLPRSGHCRSAALSMKADYALVEGFNLSSVLCEDDAASDDWRARCTTISSFDSLPSMDMHGIQIAGWPKGWSGESFSFHPWWRRLFGILGKATRCLCYPLMVAARVLSLGSEGAIFSLNGLYIS